MRDILFKAKGIDSINNGEWVEGYYTTGKDEDYTIIHYIYVAYGSFIRVDPDTVCEYTGLVDSEGNKIWENDIIRCLTLDDESNDCFAYATVEYGKFNCSCCNGVYGWTFKGKGDAVDIRRCNPDFLANDEYDKIIVVGNRFDNPELLDW